MEQMHWQYVGALGGVIGIGWLVVVPMYRGWSHLNEKMTGSVQKSVRLVGECEGRTLTTIAGVSMMAAAEGTPARGGRKSTRS